MEQYLTSEQVAKKLQVHPFTVLKYLKSGKLKGVKIGRMYRIKEGDVEKFLEKISTTPSKPSEAPAEDQEKKKPEPKQPKQPEEPIHKIEFLDDAEPKEEYYKI